VLFVVSCLRYLCLFAILVSNTYCVVFLFCLSSSCAPYVANVSGLSIFDCPFVLFLIFSIGFRNSFDSVVLLFSFNLVLLNRETRVHLLLSLRSMEDIITQNATTQKLNTTEAGVNHEQGSGTKPVGCISALQTL
jgi:hypothetical protein